MVTRLDGPPPRLGRCPRAAIALLLLAAAAPVSAVKWKEPTAAEKQIVEDPAKGLVGAVYLEKIQESAFDTFQVRVRAKILSKNGFDIGTVDDLSADAYDIEGRTLSPSGVATLLSKKDIRTMNVVKAAGVKVERKGFTLPALETGCFIEYTYREGGALGLESGYHSEILFQDKYPVVKQELKTPRPFPYSSTLRHQNNVQISLKEEQSDYIYSAANAPALRDEPYGRPIHERAAEVIFAYVFPGLGGDTLDEFWKGAAKNVLTPLVKGWMIRPGRVEERLKSVEGSREQDPAKRLRALYRYVQATVKNRSALKAGETPPKGGWKANQDAGDTLSHGEGSEADLAMVFASMLRADGWKFRIVLAPDREERFFRRDIPSVFQFDSWLVQVSHPKDPAKVTYVSFEHPLLSFGQIPWTHLGVEALALDWENATSVVIQVPHSPADTNTTRRRWNVGLNEEGDAEIDRTSWWSGQPAFQIRAELYREGKPDWEKEIRDTYQKLDPPGQIEAVSWESEETADTNLVGKLRFSRKGLASPLPGGRLEFSPLTMLSYKNPFTREDRNDPILFPYPYLDEDTVAITPPAGFVVDALPKSIDVQSDAGRYAVRIEKGEGNSILVTRTFELRRFFGNAALYPAFRSLFESAARDDSGLSVVFKKAAAAAGKAF